MAGGLKKKLESEEVDRRFPGVVGRGWWSTIELLFTTLYGVDRSIWNKI